MAEAARRGELAPILWTTVNPYVSVVILQCTAKDLPRAFRQLEDFLMEPGKPRAGNRTIHVGSGGFDARTTDLPPGARELIELEIDQVSGFVRQHMRAPSWATLNAGFVDVIHDLTILIRQQAYVAVHAAQDLNDRLQTWLNRRPGPPFRRVAARVLENALLQGEAQGLWLRSTDRRRSTRPDTKNLGGYRLQDALNVFEDSAFAVGAAKAHLSAEAGRTVLHGPIGTTPRRSSVWFKAVQDLTTFATAVLELFTLIEETRVSGVESEAMSLFARQVDDLREVSGAYEVSIADPDLLPPDTSGSEERRGAAILLERSILGVRGQPASPHVILDIGRNGSRGGSLKAVVKEGKGDTFRLDAGFEGEPTDLDPVRAALNAINDFPDLLTVFYKSGHSFFDGQIWHRRVPIRPFPMFSWEDFEGWCITAEKPDVKGSQKIHDAIGRSTDKSLFAWVVSTFGDGWLTCDDGAGEVADFVHIAPSSGMLSLIHVKGAENDSPRRRVSAVAFERVVGQAVKNLFYVDVDILRARLRDTSLNPPACWTNGKRVADRGDFFDALDRRDASNAAQIVIVQPHLSRGIYQRVGAARSQPDPSDDLMRLYLLETLLNSARSSVVGAGADLVVMGSRA